MSAGDQLFARFGRAYAVGEVLFREDEQGEHMYVIQTGRVRISKDLHGVAKTIAILGPGEFFGEMAILNDKPRTATADVVEEARLLVIDARTFEAMVLGNAEIAVRLIKKLARRLASADALIEILMHRDPRSRVILALARLAEGSTERREAGLFVDSSPTEIADQVGLSVREVEPVLARLIKLNLVSVDPDGYVVRDVARLHDFLEFLQMGESPGEG
ncbi:MAG: Crp/Fnr family transcriptional regulator [Deltaproteobacteria bacterium]|nr:Crp/Fnr family transcriptional regulator [Deltaproteobacteria bacterium]